MAFNHQSPNSCKNNYVFIIKFDVYFRISIKQNSNLWLKKSQQTGIQFHGKEFIH